MTPESQLTNELLTFLKRCPTAFHAIDAIRSELEAAGYTELSEGEQWTLTEGGHYFTVRNVSSLIAFRIPEHSAFNGFMIAASHSDSPALKLKEHPEMEAAHAYTKLNVETYGGLLMAPWFDRPLSIAGRVIVKDENRFLTKLINIDRDLCMIPSLAIHMNREANSGMKYNPQKDLLPVIGGPDVNGQLMDLIADSASVKKEDIIGSDLFLYSRSEGSIWGLNREYVSAGHLDDLQCAFASLKGFLASDSDAVEDCLSLNRLDTSEASATRTSIPVLAVFDNEEVGSGTKQGADSTFLSDVLSRISGALGISQEAYLQAIASSFMVSADNAHAIHPNAPEKADPVNQPKINEGIVIKYHANQKYTTDAVSQALFREICRRSNVPYQDFTNRSDMAGGSTLGNISNSHISLNTVDIGLPQLAMHSPYETAGVKDTYYLMKAMETFFAASLFDEGHGSYVLY